MLVKLFASAVFGINARTITIEVSANSGTQWYLVGLPDNAVKESLQRIESALKTNGYYMPNQRIIINLAPADIRKEGSAYDLPIALGILAASKQIPESDFSKFLIMGELSLDGSVLPVKGVLPIAAQGKKDGFEGFVLPLQNSREASVVQGLSVYGISNLKEVVGFFSGDNPVQPVPASESLLRFSEPVASDVDFSEVKGQENVKRALEVAAAGGHNIILIGAPGAGKTMLARRIPTILPPLTMEEALETTKIHSVAGKIEKDHGLVSIRPFRSPHHTISDVALVGGGSFPQPGEISLAHNGVLFLDELPEFKRTVLEVMRQPLEDRVVTISRARFSIEYPASFMLIASMNPCPCGYYNHPEKSCMCGSGVVQRYLSRLSGPLLDRIDIHLEVVPVPFEKLTNDRRPAESSVDIRKRVEAARLVQAERFSHSQKIHCNAQMTSRLLQKHCFIEDEGQTLLKNAMNKLGLSARAYDRILKVSRTIADLENSQQIATHHLAEAIQYRSLDRDGWAG